MATDPLVTQTQVLCDIHATKDGVAGFVLTWGPMANGDVGSQISLPGNADKTIQVTGTFGSGGSATLQGSNDGVNFFALTNPSGNTIALTSAGLQTVTEAVAYICPAVTAGDGTTSLTVAVF